MMHYDLVRLFEHPLRFRDCIPATIVTFGGQPAGQRSVQVQWRRNVSDASAKDQLLLSWDVGTLAPHFLEIEEEVAIMRDRSDDRSRQVESAAVVIAVAVLGHIEPASRFTRRSRTGTGHDYHLNESREEMIEVAGRWEGGLPSLFEEKRIQSEFHPALRKRWVSVTVFMTRPRNRTEGLHS